MSDGRDDRDARDAHDGRAPAHGRRRRRPPRVPTDRRTMATRVPVVIVLGAALAGVVALDEPHQVGAGSGAGSDAAEVAGAPMPMSPPAERGTSTWYCAAGTATDDGTADHSVAVDNAGDDEAEVTVTIYGGDMIGDGGDPVEPVAHDVDVAPGGTAEIRLGDRMTAPLAAALVEVAGGDVSVEHRVEGPHGTDAGPCATSAAETWHLAWGSTARDVRDVVVLFNPFPSGAIVDATFATDDGPREPVRFQGLPVPARSVVGVDLGEDVTGADHVSGTFEVRAGRLVIERLASFDGSYGIEGLDLGLGVPEAATTWVFADGKASAASLGAPDPATGERPVGDESGDDTGDESDDEADAGDDTGEADDPRDDEDSTVTTERIVVYNPGDATAEVDVTVVPTAADDAPAPTPPPFSLTVGAGRFEVIDYGDHDRVEPRVSHATLVRSTNGEPVVAERVLVDEGPEDDDGVRPGEVAATPGALVAATAWRVPFGAALSDDDWRTRVVVFNPEDTPAQVEVVPVSAAEDASIEVRPGERASIPLDTDPTLGSIEVVADTPVVVERVVRAEDGRRVAAGPAIPSADGAVTP